MNLSHVIRGCNPAQDHWEVEQLLRAAQPLVPARIVLEIGTHQGGSARLWRAALDAPVITVCDADEFEGDDESIERIIGRSQDAATHAQVARALRGRPVDFLFIDGGHTEQEVRRDLAYCPYVRRGGIIGFHDVVTVPGVETVWAEVRRFFRTATFWNPNGTGTGTGVVFT